MSTWWPRSCVTLLGPAAWPPPCTPSSRCWETQRTKRRIDPPLVPRSPIYNIIIYINSDLCLGVRQFTLFVFTIISTQSTDGSVQSTHIYLGIENTSGSSSSPSLCSIGSSAEVKSSERITGASWAGPSTSCPPTLNTYTFIHPVLLPWTHKSCPPSLDTYTIIHPALLPWTHIQLYILSSYPEHINNYTSCPSTLNTYTIIHPVLLPWTHIQLYILSSFLNTYTIIHLVLLPWTHIQLYILSSIPWIHIQLYILSSIPWTHIQLYILSSFPEHLYNYISCTPSLNTYTILSSYPKHIQAKRPRSKS